MGDDNRAKVTVVVIMLAIAAVCCVLWYSHTVDGVGTIQSKWVESHTSTSCDSKGQNCTTSTSYTYLVQMDDGQVFDVILGSLNWDPMQVGAKIKYQARGYSVKLGGWRLSQPTIFTWQELR